ncbi:MAG: winged helix-turn-helix transcriptional regulator [Bacteroidales bacterium]|nr:winged helix-turn-helix transcriptional regulator [Bacteroidales bacterium]
MLFGKRPRKYIRSATVKLGRFGDSDTDLISHDIIEGSILDMPERILDLLRTKYLSSPIYYEGIERKEKLEYPEKALREALLNAIVHRDYGVQTDVTIRVYSNKIVFWNSGPLIAPLNLELLKQEHPSKRRNPLIANVFFRYGYIEAWGRGILLMMEEAAKAGLPEPVLEEYAGGIQVTFLKNSTETEGKSVEKSVEKIVALILNNPSITQKEMAKQTGLSRRGVEKNIGILKKKGVITRIGPAKGGHWQIIDRQKE